MDLDAEHMDALLKGIRECDAPPPDFMDFGGGFILERESVASSESSSKRVDPRKVKQAKKKRLAKLAHQSQPTPRSQSKRKDHSSRSESIADPVDEMAVHLEDMDMKSEIEMGKEEVSDLDGSHHMNIGSDMEDNVMGKEEDSEESGSSFDCRR
jgi:hypothetical protein